MNLFNRIVLVVIFLALAAGGVTIAVLSWTLPNESIEQLGEAVQWLEDNNQELERALVAAAGLLVAVVAITFLLFELIPRGITDVKVTDVKTGDAYLSTASIGQRIEEAVSRVPHISDVRAIVKARRKGVQIELDLHVEPQADLATVTDAATEATTDVLTDQVHVAMVAPPRVRLHYRELLLNRGARRQAAVASATLATAPAAESAEPASETTPVALVEEESKAEEATPPEEPRLLAEAAEEERREAAQRELAATASSSPATGPSETAERDGTPTEGARRENE